jgi:hypothetical protein
MSNGRFGPRRSTTWGFTDRVVALRFVVAMRVAAARKTPGAAHHDARWTARRFRFAMLPSLRCLRGRSLPLLSAPEELAERFHDAIVSLTQQRGQDVLADPLAPQVIPAVAARV